MSDKTKRDGRGRISTIDKLPEDIRVGINAALRERRLTQEEIRDHFNALLEKRGAGTVSRSSFNRYSVQIEEKGSMLREAREAANALVGGLGETGGTDLGRAVTELVKTLAFDLVVNGTGKKPLNVDTLNKVALIAQRIERASKISLDRELKIQDEARRGALEDAADAIGKSAHQQGLTEEQAEYWKEQVLGIK
jgi:hypothetical protein